jgi:4-diphosphocytidyl-2-C-methyl-D-erythritol kinase
MQKIKVKAPAKINLHLEIGNKMEGGLHEIMSVFYKIPLCDYITIHVDDRPYASRGSGDNIYITGCPTIPAEQNIVFKAAKLFCNETNCFPRMDIAIEKHIPRGAGLGGGSSDCAAALNALNELFGRPLSNEKLLSLGRHLGSDVPFFFIGDEYNAAIVTGRGECVEPLVMQPSFHVELVTPKFSSDTKLAYAALDDFRAKYNTTGADANFLFTKNDLREMLELEPKRWQFKNDFAEVFLSDSYAHRAEYTDTLHSLKARGAAFTSISGSGSTCYGIFFKF